MKKQIFGFLVVSLLGLGTTASFAHGITKPQHGGQVQMVGETLFEIVPSPLGATLYVLDEDEPVDAAGMTARLTVSVAGKKTEVIMTPATGNKFFAKGLKLPTGANVGAQVVDKTTKARYGATFLIK
jgi:hypothetical protein